MGNDEDKTLWPRSPLSSPSLLPSLPPFFHPLFYFTYILSLYLLLPCSHYPLVFSLLLSPSNMPVFNWKRTRTHGPSYLVDWLVVLIMAIAWFLIGSIHPFQRKFSVEDKTIMYPYAYHETVNSVHLGVSPHW